MEKSPRNEKHRKPEMNRKVSPDGGWGWAVVFGIVLNNFFLNGQLRSSGVYLALLTEHLGVGPERLAWMTSIQTGMMCLFGTITTGLARLASPRKVAFFAGISFSSGLIVSSFSTDVSVLYFSLSFVGGLSTALAYFPGFVMLSDYFEKRRGLANGIGNSGISLGGIVQPLVLNFLAAEYGVQGALLIMGALVLHGCFGAMLWQPVEWHQRAVASKENFSNNKIVKVHKLNVLTSVINDQDKIVNKVKPEGNLGINTQQYQRNPGINSQQFQRNMGINSEQYERNPGINSEQYQRNLGINSEQYERNPGINSEQYQRNLGINSEQYERNPGINSEQHQRNLGINSQQFQRSTDVNTSAIPKTNDFKLQSDEKCLNIGSKMDIRFTPVKSPHFKSSTTFTEVKNQDNCRNKSFCSKLIDVSLLKQPMWWVLTLSLTSVSVGFPGVQMFLPLHALNAGLSMTEASSLVSFLAGADFLGRLLFSWFADLSTCSKGFWFVGGVTVSAVSAFTFIFTHAYYALILNTIVFGLSIGCFIPNLTLVYGEAFGSEMFAPAFSLSSTVSTLGVVAGPPLIGHLLERTGSMTVCYIFIGMVQLIAASGGIIYLMV